MISYTAEIWVLVAAAAATILSGLYRWRIAERDRLQRLRLDGFRGDVPVPGGGTPWYRQFGSSIAASPFIGTVEQERLFKLLVSAGIKSRGSLANFIAMKVCGAVVLAGLVWIGLELGNLLASATIFRLAGIGAALMFGWRLQILFLAI